jgi:hypothetical protein
VRSPPLTCVNTKESSKHVANKWIPIVQDLDAAVALVTAAEEECEIYMDLAHRRISWAEDRHSCNKIRADILATLQDLFWDENPTAFAFFFAALSYIEGESSIFLTLQELHLTNFQILSQRKRTSGHRLLSLTPPQPRTHGGEEGPSM